jgi:hypothetical protein
LKIFSIELRLFQRIRGFSKLFPDKWRWKSGGVETFLNIYEDYIKTTRLFEDISREMEAFVKKCGAFKTMSIIFEDFSVKLRLFQGI